MDKDKTIKVLVTPFKYGTKGKLKKLLHGKTLDLTFAKEKDFKDIPKKEFKKYDMICFGAMLSDEDGNKRGMDIFLKEI